MAIAWPAIVGADEAAVPLPSVAAGTLFITEVQPGTSASAAEEFIELHNATDTAIDMAAYRLHVAHAGATDWQSLHRSVALAGTLEPGGYMLIASKYVAAGQPVQYLAGTAAQWFPAGLSASGGHVRLVHEAYYLQDDGSCRPEQLVIDEVEWGDGKQVLSLDGRTIFATTAGGIAAENSLQRYVGVNGGYVDTGSDMADFGMAAPTPGAGTTGIVLGAAVQSAVPASGDCVPPPEVPPSDPVVIPGPAPPAAPMLPPADVGLMAPQMSELLPNPAAPATDAADEYVELYNPNEALFDLSGFMLRTGLNGTYSYAFPDGTTLPPRGFVRFAAKDTKLVLSNTTGKAILLDPFGTVIAESGIYGKAAAGQAWIFADNTWQWTAEPTPQAANVRLVPPVAGAGQTAVKAAAAAPKKAAASKAAPKAVKTAKTTAPKVIQAASPAAPKQVAAATESQSGLLHPGVLAVAAVLAILYGAYEYRHDMAHKIRQFRTNRAARAALRQGTKGR